MIVQATTGTSLALAWFWMETESDKIYGLQSIRAAHLQQLQLHILQVEHRHVELRQLLKVWGRWEHRQLSVEELSVGIVCWGVSPQHGLTKPVALTLHTSILKRLVHDVWRHSHGLQAQRELLSKPSNTRTH